MSEPPFTRHLTISELRLPPGAEWAPQVRGWCLILLVEGIGYWRHPDGTSELSAGTMVVLTATFKGLLRASQLSEVALSFFCVEPEQLTGLVSLGEQHFFERIAREAACVARILPGSDPIAIRFRELVRGRRDPDLAHRFQLLQMFTDLFRADLRRQQSAPAEVFSVRDRLRSLIQEMPTSEFRSVNISDLAKRLNCSPRHLSRLFRAEFSTSFRQKQTEIRLARAKQLLASTNTKVLDVALESGYQSHSLFNLVFKREVGLSPGQWREDYRKTRPQRPNP
ncbi:MAG TPA: hypothetical protein DCM86_19285 [Verrucomicrobiales bacterium]|nr:hypothetical protein [Verrucomicrobiales bacterium]